MSEDQQAHQACWDAGYETGYENGYMQCASENMDLQRHALEMSIELDALRAQLDAVLIQMPLGEN